MASNTLTCGSCGRSIPLTAAMAGKTINCACGKSIIVPPAEAPAVQAIPTPPTAPAAIPKISPFQAAGASGGRAKPAQRQPTLRGAIFMILLGLVMFGLSYVEYRDLSEWERTGGTHRFHVLLRLAYEIGGKNGVAGTLILAGIGFIVAGIVMLKRLAQEK